MRIYIRTTMVIVGLGAVLLITTGLGTFAQIPSRAGDTVVALTNAAQDVGAIDVYIDRSLMIEDLEMTDPGVDIQIAPGNHLIDVFAAGENVVLVKTTEMAFEADHRYQLTLDGLKADWSVELVAIDSTVE